LKEMLELAREEKAKAEANLGNSENRMVYQKKGDDAEWVAKEKVEIELEEASHLEGLLVEKVKA